MNPEIEQLFDTANVSDLCNGVFLKIGDRYDHLIAADEYRPEERVVMLVWHAAGIVGNGGFEYLFGGDFPGDPGFLLTAEAFEQIDCPPAAKAFREALSKFPNSRMPADIEERMELYKRVPETERDRINTDFWRADWEHMTKPTLREQLAKYIRANKAAFAHLQ